MTDIDQLIDEALRAEERALLASIDPEPGYVRQILALFGGRHGWVNRVLAIAQALMFAGGLWAAIRFFGASDALTALHWGLPAAVLLILSLTIKMAMYPVVEIQRLLRELKRLELQVAIGRRPA